MLVHFSGWVDTLWAWNFVNGQRDTERSVQTIPNVYIYKREIQGSFWRPDICGRGETRRSVPTRHFMYYVWTTRMTMDMADQVWCCGDHTKVVKAKRLCVKSSISRPIKRKEDWEGEEVLMMRLLTFAARENCDAICVYTPAVEGLTERQRPSAFTRWPLMGQPRSKDCLPVHSGRWMVNRGWVQSAFTLLTLKAVIIVFTSRRKRRRKQKNGMTKKKKDRWESETKWFIK